MAVPVRPAPRRAGAIAIAALLLASIATVKIASAQVHASADYLARMDANHDGRVGLSEYQDWMGYAFARKDRNHDGVLDARELAAPPR